MKKGNWVGMVPFYLLIAILCIGAAVTGSTTVTTALQNLSPQRANTIVIDAGHGGIDGGATSCTGVLESQINLEIALKLNDLLHLLGYDTVMIRTTDTSVHTEGNTIAAQKVSDLKERVRICNETDNAMVVSIHQNTFPDHRYSGAQVFYAKTEGSRELASALQTQLGKALNPGVNRKCKASEHIYLMENLRCPGILVECGFLSNPQEEALLREIGYQQKLCCVIASALSEFLRSDP